MWSLAPLLVTKIIQRLLMVASQWHRPLPSALVGASHQDWWIYVCSVCLSISRCSSSTKGTYSLLETFPSSLRPGIPKDQWYQKRLSPRRYSVLQPFQWPMSPRPMSCSAGGPLQLSSSCYLCTYTRPPCFWHSSPDSVPAGLWLFWLHPCRCGQHLCTALRLPVPASTFCMPVFCIWVPLLTHASLLPLLPDLLFTGICCTWVRTS